MPPNPPSKAHGLAMRSMSLRDMQIPKSEKKILGPPPAKSWGRPCYMLYNFVLRYANLIYAGLTTKGNRVLQLITWISLLTYKLHSHIVCMTNDNK